MPLREFGCPNCGARVEVYHPSINPAVVPPPLHCDTVTQLLWSVPKIDTSSTFQPMDYKGPDGRRWQINNLHDLRKVEHAYLETGHNIRFDAYSADPSNPDETDGFGLDYWDGSSSYTTGKVTSLPTMD